MPSASAIARSEVWMTSALRGPVRSRCFCAAVSSSSRGSTKPYPIPGLNQDRIVHRRRVQELHDCALERRSNDASPSSLAASSIRGLSVA